MLSLLKGFRDFVLRGNVIELAVAVAVGTAFTVVVKQFGDSFITPLIAAIGGGGIDGGTFTINGQKFAWAAFVNSVIFFLITAAAIYLVIITPMNKFAELRRRGQAPPETPPTEQELLTEIRDLLRARRDERS